MAGILYTLVGFVGLCIGSFANVVIDRLPAGDSIWFGRSRCDGCKRTLRWFELVPVLSFLMQFGRCRRCNIRLSWQYPAVEAAFGFLSILLFQRFVEQPIHLVGFGTVAFALIVLLVTDFKYMILPDEVILLGIHGALLLFGSGASGFSNLLPAIVAALVGFDLFAFIWYVSGGKAMGLGDAKLAVLIGLLTGYPGAVFAYYTAFLTGAVAGVILILRHRKRMKSRIAFGPFLIFGTVVAMVWRVTLEQVWSTYIW